MAKLLDLPSELAIQTLRCLTIDDILSLRLTASRFHHIIDVNIQSIAYVIARNTFPRARLLLRKPKHGVYDFRWLKSLIPTRLAAIVLDKDKSLPWRANYSTGDRIFDGVPAEDDRGDGPRARLANGWRVLQRISHLYRDVYSQHTVAACEDNIMWVQDGVGQEWTESDRLAVKDISQREYAVWRKAVSLILQLQPQDCEDILLLFGTLADAFRASEVQEWRYSIFYPPEGPEITYFLDCTARRTRDERFCQWRKWRHFDKGNSWLNAFILREGPSLFWEQWQRRPSGEYLRLPDYPAKRIMEPKPASDANSHYIRNRIREAWGQRTPAAAYVEREYASYIWYALQQRAFRSKEPISPTSTYNSLLDSPKNNTRVPVRKYRKWFYGQTSHLISESEWSWYQWQQRVIGIDEDAELNKDWVSENAPRSSSADEGEFFAQLDSLDDVNFHIWL